MAPKVRLECTKRKKVNKNSKDLSFAMMGKPRKLSKEYCFDPKPDKLPRVVKIHESEVGGTIHAGSDCSNSPKRKKRINVGTGKSDGFDVPLQVFSLPKMSGKKRINVGIGKSYGFNVILQVFSLSKMSGPGRKELEKKLRSELEQVQLFKRKFFTRSITTVGVTKVRSVNGNEKNCDPSPPLNISNSVLMKQCDALLKRLMSQNHAWVFNSPVDVMKLKIPDYYNIIKHPMDLETIKTKISTGAYPSPWDFAADVRLTFTNAMTFNPPNDEVHFLADTFSKFFETHWKPIEKKLAALDAHVKNEIQASKPGCSNKRRKISHIAYNDCKSGRTMHQMTEEEKHSLFTRLASHLVDLPDHIIDFLRRQSGNMNQSIGYIDIDIESLSDDTLFELQNLLDEHLREREKRQQITKEQCKVEGAESGVSGSRMHPDKDYDDSDEEVDICGDDGPILSYPTLELKKEADCSNLQCSSTSNSTSDSSSSSDSDSTSGSESEDEVSIPNQVSKDNSGNKSGSDQEKSDIMNPTYVNRHSNELNCSEKYTDSKLSLVESNRCQEGKHALAEREDKIYRAALLRNRFADTISKAREKMKTLGQDSKGDPEKLGQQWEETERLQREEKARLQAKAEAAANAPRQAKVDAAAEAKRKRELEREAARQALVKIEKTVEINEYSTIMKDLEMLRSLPTEGFLVCIDEKSLNYALDELRGYRLNGGSPLEKLGLFLKADDGEEEDSNYNIAPVSDVEEGEIV